MRHHPNRQAAESPGSRIVIWLLAAGVWSAAQSVTEAEEPLGVFPIGEYDQMLYLNVEVAGTERLAVLDSGCTVCVIDEDLPAVARLERTEKSVHGSSGRSAPLPLVEGLSIRVSGLTLPQDKPVALLDFGKMRRGLGRPIGAVVGMPLFRRCVVQLDFDQGECRILPVSTKPSDDWGRVAQITYSKSDLPHLSFSVADADPESFLVDTGSAGSLGVPTREFQAFARAGQIQVGSKVILCGIHRNTLQRTGRVESCNLLGFTQCDAEIAEGNEHRIGLKYLRRFHITFDLANDHIFFSPNESFDAPWPRCDYSVGVARQENQTTINYIERYSSASESGLWVGDELHSMNGASIESWPIGKVRKQLREAESDLELVVDRFGEAITISLPRGVLARP